MRRVVRAPPITAAVAARAKAHPALAVAAAVMVLMVGARGAEDVVAALSRLLLLVPVPHPLSAPAALVGRGRATAATVVVVRRRYRASIGVVVGEGLLPRQRVPVRHGPPRPVRLGVEEVPFKGNFFRRNVVLLRSRR